MFCQQNFNFINLFLFCFFFFFLVNAMNEYFVEKILDDSNNISILLILKILFYHQEIC